ncbi:MAG: hypothetical protein V7629_18315 [Motiliproteus sp.]
MRVKHTALASRITTFVIAATATWITFREEAAPMYGFYNLVRPQDLSRDDLPRVLRPFWALSKLNDVWSPTGHDSLLAGYRRLAGFCYSGYRDAELLQALKRDLESGRVIMLDNQDPPFRPVVTGRGAQMQLQPDLVNEPFAFKISLERALQRRSGGGRPQAQPQQPQAQPKSEDNRPLTFEESIAANQKFFGQPVSASEPQSTARHGTSLRSQAQAQLTSLSQAQAQAQAPGKDANGVVSKHSPEAAFHVVREPISRTALVAQLYGDIGAKPDHFDRLNPGLGGHILPGEMIVLGDPEGLSCTRQESDLMQVAEQVNSQVRALDEGEAQFITKHYDLLNMMTSNTQAGLGVGAVMIERQISGIESTLRNIEQLHQDSYRTYGHLNDTEFFNKRQALLKQLDFGLGSVAREGMSLNDNPKLKRALGVSTKSLVHNWKQTGVGELPGYASQYGKLASATKYAKTGGHIAIALDVSISGFKIKEACTSGNSQSCEVVAYKETGRILGSAGGGYAGSLAAGGCGLLGITTGIGGLVCVILVGGVGAAAGGYAGGSGGEVMGEVVREIIHND